MDRPLDPDQFRLPESMTAPITPSTRPPRHRPKEPFLKGPIPWAWLDLASRLPGKALALGLVLWQSAGFHGRRTVHICLANSRALGLNKHSARRGIRALERASLVEVRHRPGRGLDVTILEVRAETDGDKQGDDDRRTRRADIPDGPPCGGGRRGDTAQRDGRDDDGSERGGSRD
jgi:hypothetical protein